MIYDKLRDWLAYECYGGTVDVQAIMLDRANKREFEAWLDDNNIKYSMIDYCDAPRPDNFDDDIPSNLKIRRNIRWQAYRFTNLLYFIPDHTQWVYAKMAWS